ncbi:MAG: heparinase II/III family protein [Phycisphaerae bacterium]
MKYRSIPALGVVVLLASSVSFAQQFVNIGKLKVRADSPIARGEYPRLALTKAQIPAIRARMNNPELQTYLKQAEDLVKMGKASYYLLASMYQATGDIKYADLAKEKLGNPSWYPDWTLAFDMVAETMTDAERTDYARKILERVKANQWRPRVLHCLVAWGNGVDDELAPFLQSSHAREVVGTLEGNNRWSLGRGGSSMGHGYNGEHFFSAEWAAIMGWTNATGEDLISKSDFAHNTPAWYVYHYLPWQRGRQVIRIGVTMNPSHLEALTPRKHRAEDYVMLDITKTRNGLGQWWQREFIGKWPQPKWNRGQEHIYGLGGRLLWLDPAIPSVSPDKFPETRLFPVNGHVVMRSDWTEDATVAIFRCGRFGTIDGTGGRNNLDNLQFMIYRKGYLAPPTGCKHSVNEGVWKMQKGRTNVHQYGKQTIAHNSITVGRNPIKLFYNKTRVIGIIPRGGQSTIRQPNWFKAWGLKEEEAKGFKQGDITAYSTSPEYDYATGDATHSYPPERVKKITRQFVYIKPDLFVIFDRVTPTDPKLEIIWNLHAYKKPEWNGKTEPTKMPEGHREGGHFTHTTGDTFRIDNNQSAMVVKTLLPKADARLIRTIGGKWHDFEVNGVNPGPTDATYERLDKLKGNGGLEGVGGWRIEVTPTGVRGEVHFLHVLHLGDKNTLKPADISLITKAGLTGAKMALAGKTYEVTFNTAGETSGHIMLSAGAKRIDENLVGNIEDNYDRWKADPRYKEWQTSEFMRTVIFPYGKKP